MNYTQLKSEFENTVSLKLLRHPHAALILSFLYRQFKQAQQIMMPYQQLVDALDETLEQINHDSSDNYPRPARDYLDHWSKELGLLRIFHDADNTLYAQLTPAVERTLRWLEELHERPFIGTESRFLSIFTTLREIVSESSSIPEDRIAYLRQQQETIQIEIDTIEATGRVTSLSSTQIRERFMQASENALRLLSDFAGVEQNFRDLARSIQEAALQPDMQKGAVLGNILDADESLENSDEGRSFRAFWHFMLTPSQKDELSRVLVAVMSLPDIEEFRTTSPLSSLTKRLLDAGQKIIASNRLLSEQLRRLLDERAVVESRRVRQLCTEIKQRAFHHADHPPLENQFLYLELAPETNLLYDRPLWSPISESRFADRSPVAEFEEEVFDNSLLNALYTQFHIDRTELEAQVSQLLERHASVTLGTICTVFPPKKGVAEVLAYLDMAAHHPHHRINPNATEAIVVDRYDNKGTIRIDLPRVEFHRRTSP